MIFLGEVAAVRLPIMCGTGQQVDYNCISHSGRLKHSVNEKFHNKFHIPHADFLRGTLWLCGSVWLFRSWELHTVEKFFDIYCTYVLFLL